MDSDKIAARSGISAKGDQSIIINGVRSAELKRLPTKAGSLPSSKRGNGLGGLLMKIVQAQPGAPFLTDTGAGLLLQLLL